MLYLGDVIKYQTKIMERKEQTKIMNKGKDGRRTRNKQDNECATKTKKQKKRKNKLRM